MEVSKWNVTADMEHVNLHLKTSNPLFRNHIFQDGKYLKFLLNLRNMFLHMVEFAYEDHRILKHFIKYQMKNWKRIVQR